MTEHIAPLFAAERIIVVVAFDKQVKKIFNVRRVNKFILVRAEEFAEIESFVLNVIGLIQKLAQVVGVNVHLGQFGVGIVFKRKFFFEVGFGSLLHNVIPSVNAFLVEVVKQIERRAAQREELCLFLDKFFNDGVAQRGLSSFVSLVDDNAIPIRLERFGIFIVFAADGIGAAQVLNRGEVDEIFFAAEQIFKRRASIF